jgi:mediator of RNA polymerase II transcription subunit 12
VPPVLPEILLLADDPNPEAPSILANSLWYKYRTAFDWAWKVWDNTVASLRQIPVMTLDMADRQACALCYGRFLLHVDQHLPGGIDDQVLQWFLGTGKNEVSALSADAWDVLTFVLLYLTVHGALTATTILRGLVYPAWRLSASANSEHQGESLAIFLGAANNLCDKLLLRDAGGTDGMAPVDLPEVQRICTRRQTVYLEPHYSLLVTAIPTLVFIEKNKFISQDLRDASASLRTSVCATSDFRQGAHRNLDAVRNAFEQPLLSEAVVDDCHPLVEALRVILSDSPSSLWLILHYVRD